MSAAIPVTAESGRFTGRTEDIPRLGAPMMPGFGKILRKGKLLVRGGG